MKGKTYLNVQSTVASNRAPLKAHHANRAIILAFHRNINLFRSEVGGGGAPPWVILQTSDPSPSMGLIKQSVWAEGGGSDRKHEVRTK